MNNRANYTIVPATPKADLAIAQHFYQLWLDNDVAAEEIRENWLVVTCDFITKTRQELKFQAFVAKVEERIVGSASCQLFAGLYPSPFKSNVRRYGYIWNVFVESPFRRQGIATELTKTAIAHLKSLDCSHAILHASPHGLPVYQQLGFVNKNEMILKL